MKKLFIILLVLFLNVGVCFGANSVLVDGEGLTETITTGFTTYAVDTTEIDPIVVGNTLTIAGNSITGGNAQIDFTNFDVESTGTLTTGGGRIVNTSRYTTTQTILVTDHAVFADTDTGAWTATLLAGVEGAFHHIANVGTLDLTVQADGAELLFGANSQTLSGGEIIDIYYNSTEGWW